MWESCIILTLVQRSFDWSIQKQIEVTASISGRLFKCAPPFRSLTDIKLRNDKENPTGTFVIHDSNLDLAKKSSEPMIRGVKNAASGIAYLRERDISFEVFDTEIIGSKEHPVLDSSPGAIALLHYPNF